MTAVKAEEIVVEGETGKRHAVANRAQAAITQPAAGRASTVADLLQTAVATGTPVEQLEKLVDLYERMEAKEAAKAFSAALAEFQSICPTIVKNRTGKVTTNKGGGYSFTFADLHEIVTTIRPYAAQCGLSFRWDHEIKDNTLTSVFILSHIAGHSEATRYSLPIDNPSGMSPQQKVGAAQTFADRRSLTSGLGLTSVDEADAEAGDVDPKKITDDQVTVLSDLLAETNTDLSRFLNYAGVSKLSDIRAADYDRVHSALIQKREKKS